MAKRTSPSYDAEFKNNAVGLSQKAGRTVIGVAESLWIFVDLLYRWRQKSDAHGQIIFSGQGCKIRDPEKRLKTVEIERDIFSKPPK